MTKREMLNSYYDDVKMRSSELSLKFGIEDGSIVLNGNEISGKTYDAKEAIKHYFGAKWNSVKKCWVIQKEQHFAELIFSEGLVVS